MIKYATSSSDEATGRIVRWIAAGLRGLDGRLASHRTNFLFKKYSFSGKLILISKQSVFRSVSIPKFFFSVNANNLWYLHFSSNYFLINYGWDGPMQKSYLVLLFFTRYIFIQWMLCKAKRAVEQNYLKYC